MPAFKGYVQSPNDFFQLPFMSAIARETARHALSAAGRADEAAALQWRPRMAAFPHPQLSPGVSSYILPPFIFVACMFATISLLSALVHEKESGLRQALTTMGLQQLPYWASWWLFEAVMWAAMAWCITGFGEGTTSCWQRCQQLCLFARMRPAACSCMLTAAMLARCACAARPLPQAWRWGCRCFRPTTRGCCFCSSGCLAWP